MAAPSHLWRLQHALRGLIATSSAAGAQPRSEAPRPKMIIRQMLAADLTGVANVEAAGYPDLAAVGKLEGMEGLGEHHALHPEGCYVAEVAEAGGGREKRGTNCGRDIVGYVLSGPARLDDCPLAILPLPAGEQSNWTAIAAVGPVCDSGHPGCAEKVAVAETIYLHDIVVRPEARQHGVGKQLMAAVERLAEKVNAPTITLTAVAGAWEHWGRRGFVELARKSTACVAAEGQEGLLSEAAVQRLASYPDALGDVRFMRRWL